MTLELSSVVVPSVAAGLTVLDSILAKARAFSTERKVEPAALLEARLVPDMFTFANQIQLATDTARRAIERLAEQEVSSKPDPEPTFDALEARIRETLEAVRKADVARIDASVDRAFEVAYTPELKVPYTGKTYAMSFLIPNFYFHVVTAYNILRERGVVLGKMDFLAPVSAEYKVM